MMKKILAIGLLLVVCGVAITLLKRKPNLYSVRFKGSVVEKYGTDFNPERSNRGVPIIENSWTVRDYDSTYVRWSNPTTFFYSSSPEHIWKELHFRDSVIVSEEDVFNYNYGDSIADRLIVNFNFKLPDSSKFEFLRHYFKRYPPSESAYLSFQSADSILNAWGFRNFYPELKEAPKMEKK